MQNKRYIKKPLQREERMAQKKLEEKENKINFDFTTPELEYILANARFNDIQRRVFSRLVDINGRQSIVQISLGENISTATVSRIIKQIKNKILRLL